MAPQNRIATRAHSPPQGQQGEQGEEGELRYALDRQGGGGDAEETCHQLSQKSGEEAGNDGGVVHHPHADHLHGEYRRPDRGAEKGGEPGGHPGCGDNVEVPVIQLQQTAQLVADTAADLEGGPLPPGAATGEVGEDGGQEDQRQHPEMEVTGVPDGGQNELGAAVVVHVHQVVYAYDGQPR